MAMRKTQFANGEHYHIFNRGVDKRDIYLSKYDIDRFFQSMDEFNVIDPIGSIYANSFLPENKNSKQVKKEKLVNFVCYCLNSNHYHFILEQINDRGIEKFMHKLGSGYPKYFNHRYKRSGALFQGKFKAVHIDSNEQLLHTSVYVNLNDKIHSFRSLAPKWVKSSWKEYLKKESSENEKNYFCEKDIILGQFQNIRNYEEFAKSSLMDIEKRKEMEKLLLDK